MSDADADADANANADGQTQGIRYRPEECSKARLEDTVCTMYGIISRTFFLLTGTDVISKQ